MFKKLKIFSITFCFLLLAGVGCQDMSNNTTAENSATITSAQESAQEYNWKKEGITFKYSKALSIIDLDSALLLNAEGNTNIPPGEASVYYTRIEVIKNATIEEVLKPYYDDQTILKSKSIKKIGDYNFTRLQYEDYKQDYIVDHYFLQMGDNVLDYKAGYKDNKGDVELTLSSLEFNQ